LQSAAKREFEAIARIGSYSVHADSKWKVPLADRRSAPFRLVPVLWLRVRARGHLLRYAQEYGFCSEPGEDVHPRKSRSTAGDQSFLMNRTSC
jgi:hypothetical protein